METASQYGRQDATCLHPSAGHRTHTTCKEGGDEQRPRAPWLAVKGIESLLPSVVLCILTGSTEGGGLDSGSLRDTPLKRSKKAGSRQSPKEMDLSQGPAVLTR